MHITYGVPIMAPQTTGHPAALPADAQAAASTQQVTPPAASSDTSDAQHRDHPHDQNTAPPSAMQIKIMELLEQQAREAKMS
ncbi:hypothetical protein ACXYMO_11440 [Arenibacterium sp. CAU 1754]